MFYLVDNMHTKFN